VEKRYFAGVDIGSLTCDAVIIDESGKIAAYEVMPTGARSRAAAEKALAAALERLRLRKEGLAVLVSTGYGRELVESRLRAVSEITCHARGAVRLFPGTRLVLDVGGQDSKAIRLASDGRVRDFAMNDKCAAGTGRFFEVMARALEIDLDDLGPRALASKKDLSLSSVCTVFAESEVVGMVARGETVEDIAAALCAVAAEKVVALAHRVGVEGPVTVTGGVPKNVGFLRALEAQLGQKVNLPPEPQIVGALGAALIGVEELCSVQAARERGG
jgi:predicted CoA-substrate-specific enzyme activase